ncbi:hybrid sensor histidine kinase/response regulator transcription factor [Leeuwenhoekiella sp. W20_SRS_FM14]|uniref:hybrid sensor histidine kinase/response regulator transcription factor n=1 Tax=Leeuwenhoekiella sp. W20_SRS_FM14 TaxID=3240270 RepID=UPI003F9D207E
MINKIYLLFLACILSWSFYGQTENLKNQFPLERRLSFYNLDTEKGLSNNTVKSIVEDSLGFLWIGTSDGLNKYDGNEFKIFRKENSALSNNYIQNLILSKSGTIKIATDGGVNNYNPRKEQLTLFNEVDPTLSLSINSLIELKDSRLVIGAYNQGLHIFNKNNKEVYLGEHHLTSLKISSLANQQDSIIWIGTFDKGVDKLNLNTLKVEHIAIETETTKSNWINCLFVDSKNNLWIGTNNGLTVRTPNGRLVSLNETNTKYGLSNNQVHAVAEDNYGQIWIGTYAGGLNIINPNLLLKDDLRFSVRKYLPKEDGSSIYNATINTIFKDHRGYMWIGTNAGLNFVDPDGEPVKLLKNDLIGSQKLAHDRISSISECATGKIYLGTDGGGIDIYDPVTGNFNYSVYSTANGLKSNQVQATLRDNAQRLWIGTYRDGLNMYNLATQKWSYYLQGDTQDGNDVRVVYQDFNNDIWAGTNRGGLYKYNTTKDTFDYVSALDVIYPKMDIRDIKMDRHGILWMASYGNGVLRYNPKTKKAYSYFNGSLGGMTNNVVFCIWVLDDDSIVAGLKYGGIIHFNRDDTEALNLTEKDGLSNNTVNSMALYDDSSLWLGTYKGISKYNYIDHTLENINTFNNIQKSEYNIGAALKSSSGFMYFGGNKGLTIFKPEELNVQRTTNSIIIKNLSIFNTDIAVESQDENAILKESIAYSDQLILKHNQNNFSLDFTSLKFPFADNVNYSYNLEGYNEFWTSLKNSNRINFSNIPPGDYTLKIVAESDVESPYYKEFKITILPPFWKTLPAYIFYIITSIILITAGLRYYSERIKLKNSLLFEKKQRQLEQDLNEERIRFYTGFSHELKTPLTLILAPLETLLEEIKQKEQRNSLKLIKRNANNLLQFINKLLEFRKSEEGLSKLNLNEYNLSKHITKWLATYKPLLKKKNINLTVTMPQNPIKFYCDLEKLHIIINNLLSNAIKYTTKDGQIKVSFTQDDTSIYLSISDSGSGIMADDLNHIFEWYYQSNTSVKKDGTGIGLALSKRFAELHNGTLDVTSNPGIGSTFTLTLPKDDRLIDAFLENSPNALFNKKAVEQRIKDADISIEKTTVNNLLVQTENARKLILLIDDNPDILEFLDSALASKYDLIHSENGEEGIQQATKYIPDLIISDIMMPVKTGIDLCHFLKNNKETSHIPIILLSAKSNFEMIETGYTEGADDYMVKPFNVQVLRARIENLIATRKKLLEGFIKNANENSNQDDADRKLLQIEKKFLEEFHTAVYDNMQQGIKTVEVVSEEIGMSRSSLFRKIKAITGQNINEYIRNLKIERAAHLIEKENFTVSQAAFEVGFADAKYFRKIFKEKYGKTPSTLK